MKIRFTKRRLYAPLIVGALWFVLGVTGFIIGENIYWFGYGYLMIAILYLGHFLYDQKHQYLIIKNGRIQKNMLFSFTNRIEIDEIEEVKRIRGNYILKSKKTNLKINPHLIKKESLENLIEFLSKLKVPSEKSFLTSQK